MINLSCDIFHLDFYFFFLICTPSFYFFHKGFRFVFYALHRICCHVYRCHLNLLHGFGFNYLFSAGFCSFVQFIYAFINCGPKFSYGFILSYSCTKLRGSFPDLTKESTYFLSSTWFKFRRELHFWTLNSLNLFRRRLGS